MPKGFDKHFEMKGEVFVHATEDLDKVKDALLFLLPEEHRNSASVKDEVLMGNWGNKIHFLRLKVQGEKPTMDTLNRLFSGLNGLDKAHIRRKVSDFIDEKSRLFLRLSKQDACMQKISLKAEGGIIHCMFRFKARKSKQQVEDLLREKLEFDN